MRAATAALLLLLSACMPGVKRPASPAVLLEQTPFFPQEEFQCGPAALATVLVASAVPVLPEDLIEAVYLPARQGSLQLEMAATARRHGRVPYPLETLESLHAALRENLPVLLLQNLGLESRPIWHYAVLIGHDPARDEFILRSGREPLLRMKAGRFESSWARAGRWARVMMRPDSIPSFADSSAWIEAASAFEQLQQPERAETAYRAAVERWPQSALAWQALGNARHALGNTAAAIDAYRAAVRVQPTAAAYNNLAHLLGLAGCVEAGLAALESARAQSDAAVVASALAQTRASLQRSVAADSAACAP